jgi:PilZ domain
MPGDNAEERNFVRIDTLLPLHYHFLTPNKYRREKSRILMDRQAQVNPFLQLMERWSLQDEQGMRGGDLDRLIVPVLAVMNEKLDHILAILNPNDPMALRFEAPQWVNISGSGIGLILQENFPLDAALLLELLLPFPFPLMVKAIGRVTRVEPVDADHLDADQQQWYVGTQFDVIREEDREAIIRYIFREQRVALRARSVSTSPSVSERLPTL